MTMEEKDQESVPSTEEELEYTKRLLGQAVLELEETKRVLSDTEGALLAMTRQFTTLSDITTQLTERIRRHSGNMIEFTVHQASCPSYKFKTHVIFRKDDRFLMTSFNHFNGLGLGLTQLYNHTLVYNFKRHERVQLGAKTFEFKRVPHFPKRLSKEFLLIDLLNNLKHLAEDEIHVEGQLKEKIAEFDPVALKKTAGRYGRARTRHLIDALYDSSHHLSS